MKRKLLKLLKYSKWHDDLIWCPSQCHLYFTWEKHKYCLYLRWRWDDPWTATLITLKGRDLSDGTWYELEVPFHEAEDLKGIKASAICKITDELITPQKSKVQIVVSRMKAFKYEPKWSSMRVPTKSGGLRSIRFSVQETFPF